MLHANHLEEILVNFVLLYPKILCVTCFQEDKDKWWKRAAIPFLVSLEEDSEDSEDYDGSEDYEGGEQDDVIEARPRMTQMLLRPRRPVLN